MSASEIPTGPEASGFALKAYDVRLDRERGRRRQLAQATRRVLRVATLVLLDLLVLSAALAAALRLTGAGRETWRELVFPVLAIQVLALLLVNAYAAGSSRNDATATLRAVTLTAAVLGLQLLLSPGPALAPATMFVFAMLAAAGLALERALVQQGVRALRLRGHLVRPALLITRPDSARELARQVEALPHSDLRVAGHFPVLTAEGTGPSRRDMETQLDAMDVVIRDRHISVVVVEEGLGPEAAEPIISRSFDAGCTVLVLPSPVRSLAARLAATSPAELQALELFPPRLALPQLSIKRAMDVLIASAALALLSPLLLTLAAAIKLSSRGPVFFRQTRVGVGGRQFTMYKFRTMRRDAEALKAELEHLNQYGDGRLFKIKDDPRATRLGRVLRRTSLDELPQLFNVVRGEMSLVGPRPPVPEEVAGYSERHLVRLTVIPGMTGPWQANGRSDLLSFEEVVRLERDYIRNWSILLDLKLIGKTLVAVARGEGAR